MKACRTVTLNVVLTYEEHKALKQLALDRDTNMSDMVRAWLRREAGLEPAGQDDGNGGR